MGQEDARRELLRFLDERAFDPVLRARPEDYPESKRPELAEAQRATRSERERFHSYRGVDEIYRMFHDDLSSDAALQIHRKLRDLDLPTIADIRIEFERKARALGVAI